MATPEELRSKQVSAIKELESFIAAHPENAGAHFRVGQLYHAAGDQQKTLAHLAEAVRLNPKDLPARKMLADFQYVEIGDLEGAITNYVRILEQDPRNVENLTILGNLSLSASRFEEARTFFTAIARLEPWNGEVRKTLEAIARKLNGDSAIPTYQAARERAERGDTLAAIRDLENIVAADPGHVLAHNDLGVMYAAQGNVRRALDHELAAVQLEPDNITVRKNLADLYQGALNAPEEALRHYMEILRRTPADVETLLSIGSLCIALERHQDARAFFSTALAHDPANVMARELLGRIDALAAPAPLDDELPSMFTSDRIEEVLREKHKYAREYLNDVLRQEPGNRPARRGLDALTSPQGTGAVDVRARYAEATSKAAQGDPAGAKTILREIVGRDPSFAPAHNDLAVLSVNDGETAQARMHYERAVALAPESVVFRKNLGDFYFAVSGDPESALEQYIKVLGQKPNEVETLLSIAQVCESLRRFEDASAFYTTVAQLEPGNRLAQEGLTRVNAPHTETAMSHGRTN